MSSENSGAPGHRRRLQAEAESGVVMRLVHRVILWLLQTYRRIGVWLAAHFARLRWFHKYKVTDQPFELRKKPALPAIASESDEDFIYFIQCCASLEIETVALYKPSGLVLDSFIALLQRKHFQVEQYTFGINSSIVVTYGMHKLTLHVLSGRESYVSAIQERSIGPATETARLGTILGNLRIDFLLFVGLDTVGDFPPLALRACELYFVPSPLKEADISISFLRFARSEQRSGT